MTKLPRNAVTVHYAFLLSGIDLPNNDVACPSNVTLAFRQLTSGSIGIATATRPAGVRAPYTGGVEFGATRAIVIDGINRCSG